MSDFADLFPDDELMYLLGDDVTYSAQGGPAVAVKAIVDDALDRAEVSDSRLYEARAHIRILKSAAPDLAKGDVFSHRGRSLTVSAVVGDDGTYFTCLAV